MQDEIFGPLLPVLSYDTLGRAIADINERPRPLAIYWFGRNPLAQAQVLAGTVSGGVCVNDTLTHIAHDKLPFGGVGDSGWGAYHGITGFLRFSQQKPVMLASPWSRVDLFYPPYGPRFKTAMRLIKWLF
jgi:coniferyl-aldehyde dehydrogenase